MYNANSENCVELSFIDHKLWHSFCIYLIKWGQQLLKRMLSFSFYRWDYSLKNLSSSWSCKKLRKDGFLSGFQEFQMYGYSGERENIITNTITDQPL